MSSRGNQFPQLKSPAVTICHLGNGWGFCFNKPCQREAIGTKKFVEITTDRENRRIYLKFVSFKKKDTITVSICGKKSSYRSATNLAGIPVGLLESFPMRVSEKRQFVLHRNGMFGDIWHINF